MIAQLTGTIRGKEKDAIIIDVGGVGYEVRVSPTLLLSLEVREVVTLYTHFHVREDSQELYGFIDHEQKIFFRTLLSVNGVGPKSALHILGLGTVAELRDAIGRGDITYLTKVSGIGKKTAERIVVELKGKLAGAAGVSGVPATGPLADVVDALSEMGYGLDEIREVIAKLKEKESVIKTAGSATSGELLKEALRLLHV